MVVAYLASPATVRPAPLTRIAEIAAFLTADLTRFRLPARIYK
jgi:hypothetical protein